MSIEHQTTLKCPKCGHEVSYTVWDSLNAQLNPDAATQLKEGKLFTVKCSECGVEIYAPYPMLYHDMDHGLMIQLILPEKDIPIEKSIEGYKASIKQQRENPLLSKFMSAMKQQYVHRIVTSYHDLIEKAQIFSCGFDDRTMEILKLFYMMSFVQNQKEALPEERRIEMVRFESDSKTMLFMSNRGIEFTAAFNQDLYDSIDSKIIQHHTEFQANDEMIIDMNWATDMLSKFGAELQF